MAVDHPQAGTWQRLGYFQLVLAFLLGAFAWLMLTGLITTPRGGGLGPLLVAVVLLGLAVRSFRKSHALA